MTDTYRIRIKKGNVEIEVEGDKDFVEKHIGELKNELSKFIRKMPIEDSGKVIEKSNEELENISLAEFYKLKSPKDHNETVMVFAYWMTEKEIKKEITPKDINKCYSKIGVSKPVNIPDIMKKLASGKKAYLVKTGKRGFYKISMLGRDLIEKELPRKSEKE